MTKTVDSAEAIKLLENVRDEKGADYVYTDHFEFCELARDGEPRCIVGHVYAALGVPVEELETIYGTAGSEYHDSNNTYPIVDFEGEYGIQFTDDAKRILRRAQRQQDDGFPWGESVEGAALEHAAWGER